jgi:hypothetical protein
LAFVLNQEGFFASPACRRRAQNDDQGNFPATCEVKAGSILDLEFQGVPPFAVVEGRDLYGCHPGLKRPARLILHSSIFHPADD